MARSITASSDKIDCGTGVSFANLTEKTTAVWVYLNSGSLDRRIWQKAVNGISGFINVFYLDDTGPELAQACSRVATQEAAAPPANFARYGQEKWLFIVGTSDSSVTTNNKLYVGDLSNPGEEPSSYTRQSEGSGAFFDDSALALIVGNKSNDGTPLGGTMAWMGWWNRVLSPAELQKVWQVTRWTTGLTNYPPPNIALPPGVVLDILTDALVIDKSGFTNNGTITGTELRQPRPPVESIRFYSWLVKKC